ncbi:MAG: hypothetical protein JJ975_09375 [Bacteroidia bacterium]|nr:hypothetical protein [Bacteroidia bacterium]
MGLDISLIRIVKEETEPYHWFEAKSSPELKDAYADYIVDRTETYQNGETVTFPVYYYIEISHQRKGVKSSFYDRYLPDVTILTREGLFELASHIDHEHKARFRKLFINKFEEGKNLIMMGY